MTEPFLLAYIGTTTLAIISVVMAAAGTAAGAYSAVSAGKQAEDSAKYNAKVTRNNALSAQQQAQQQAGRIRKRNELIFGKQRANYLKSGGDLSGSAEAVILDSYVEGALDVEAAKFAGNSADVAMQAKAKLSLAEGSAAKQAGYVSAGGQVLSGAAKSSAGYANFRDKQDLDF